MSPKKSKSFRLHYWILSLLLIAGGTALQGCSNGYVPDSNPEAIESAKFDPEKENRAKNDIRYDVVN